MKRWELINFFVLYYFAKWNICNYEFSMIYCNVSLQGLYFIFVLQQARFQERQLLWEFIAFVKKLLHNEIINIWSKRIDDCYYFSSLMQHYDSWKKCVPERKIFSFYSVFFQWYEFSVVSKCYCLFFLFLVYLATACWHQMVYRAENIVLFYRHACLGLELPWAVQLAKKRFLQMLQQ